MRILRLSATAIAIWSSPLLGQECRSGTTMSEANCSVGIPFTKRYRIAGSMTMGSGLFLYYMPATSSMRRVCEEVLQNLGFTIVSTKLGPAKPFVDTKNLAASRQVFTISTDRLDLDDERLETFQTSFKHLRLPVDSHIRYGYEIAVEYDATAEGRPIITANDFTFPLRMAVIISKRGLSSSFVPETSAYYGTPILKWINQEYARRIGQLPRPTFHHSEVEQ